MLLYILVRTTDQQVKDFCCQFDDLEESWDFLRGIHKKGDTFLKAELIHHQDRYGLPLDTLNQGQTVNPFRELRQQWEQWLIPATACKPSGAGSRNYLNQRLIALHQSFIANIEQTLSQMLFLWDSAHCCLPEGPRKTRLIQQYQTTINRCSRSLIHHNASIERLVAAKSPQRE